MKLGVATHHRRLFAMLAIEGVLILGGISCAAATPKNAERGVIGGTYESELIECVFQGQEAHSKAVYAACADAVDVRYGLRPRADAGTEDAK